MSNALAIAGVTAVLQFYLENMYGALGSTILGGNVGVSARAPDLIQGDITSGHPLHQVNLFMHQVTHNTGWRNQGLPSMSSDGKTLLKNPPLALDLHYLLTAYGTTDWQAEGILGFAVLMLHQNPVFTRKQISDAISKLPVSNPTNPMSSQLNTVGLAEQVEMIKITPATLGREEMAWLWTALKADYRPTFPFQVSVVLIEPQLPTTFALPVLSRNINVQAGPPPQLFEVQLALGQTAPAQGDTVTVTGESLRGASLVALSNARLGIVFPPFAPTAVTDTSVTFKVPNDPAGLPAGSYDLSLLFTDSGGTVLMSTNTIPFALAPIISGPPTAVANAAGTLVSITSAPDLRPGQSVFLSVGAVAGGDSISAPAKAFTAQTNSASFQFPTLSGKYLVVLRVDDVDGPVQVDWTAKPPKFTGPFVTI